MPCGLHLGAADGARGLRGEPRVDAHGVEGVAAGGERAHHLPGLERAEADRALEAGRGGRREGEEGERGDEGGVEAALGGRRLGGAGGAGDGDAEVAERVAAAGLEAEDVAGVDVEGEDEKDHDREGDDRRQHDLAVQVVLAPVVWREEERRRSVACARQRIVRPFRRAHGGGEGVKL